jgi:hypothetical protein
VVVKISGNVPHDEIPLSVGKLKVAARNRAGGAWVALGVSY